jgi:hypothetical protein
VEREHVLSSTAASIDAARGYLEETVRVWLGLPRGVEPPALPDRLARLLLRLEEHERPDRDEWGCWDYELSENARTLWVPEIDLWLVEQRKELEDLEPLWPDGHDFAVCLTHDVDVVSRRATPAQVLRSARAGVASGGGVRRLARPPVRVARAIRNGVVRAPSLRDTLERSVALEAERGAVASYLFTVPPAGPWTRWDCLYAPHDRCDFRGRTQRIQDVMRTLNEEGFDIGLHGSYESARVPGVLARERAELERALGSEVTSTRQHFLHWDVRWTPALQADAGLRTDSSLGFNRNVGFRAGTSLPFRHFDVTAGRTLDLLEVPLVGQDAALLGPIGLRLGPDETRRVVKELFDRVRGVGGLITVVFHPDKLVRPEWLALYEWTLDEAAASGGWLTSLARLDTWWRERERGILDA